MSMPLSSPPILTNQRTIFPEPEPESTNQSMSLDDMLSQHSWPDTPPPSPASSLQRSDTTETLYPGAHNRHQGYSRPIDIMLAATSEHAPPLLIRTPAVLELEQNITTIDSIVITEKIEQEVELQVVSASVHSDSLSPVDEFFNYLQAAEDFLDKGRGYLKTLQELGLKDGLLTRLDASITKFKDVIDRAQALKKKIDNHEIADAILEISTLKTELEQSIDSLKALYGEAVDKIDELKSCCSSFFSCFGSKSK
jgi:hypothetical protein